MQLIIDKMTNIDGEDHDWESIAGTIEMTDDAEGRVYLHFGKDEIGIDLPDLLKFIHKEMME